MANANAICNSFKRDLLDGVHHLGASPDTIYAALYLASGSQGAASTAYSATNEVSGTGYTAGGVAVTNANAPSLDGSTAIWTPSGSIVYPGVTLPTAFDCVMLYNETAAGKNAISCHTFGAQTITAGTLTLTMPPNAAATALVAIA